MRYLTLINEETMNQWVIEYKLLSNKPIWEFLQDKGVTRHEPDTIHEFLIRLSESPMTDKTYKEVIAELDALIDEFVLLARDINRPIGIQVSVDIDNFLINKLGDAYSPEGEYVWYSMMNKYLHIFDTKGEYRDFTNTLQKNIRVLKNKYQ